MPRLTKRAIPRKNLLRQSKRFRRPPKGPPSGGEVTFLMESLDKYDRVLSDPDRSLAKLKEHRYLLRGVIERGELDVQQLRGVVAERRNLADSLLKRFDKQIRKME